MDRLVGWLEINYLIESEQFRWLELEAHEPEMLKLMSGSRGVIGWLDQKY